MGAACGCMSKTTSSNSKSSGRYVQYPLFKRVSVLYQTLGVLPLVVGTKLALTMAAQIIWYSTISLNE